MKRKLRRIVAMLTRMAIKLDGVAEAAADYRADSDYEHAHRFAEHEHGTASKPEPSVDQPDLAEWMRCLVADRSTLPFWQRNDRARAQPLAAVLVLV